MHLITDKEMRERKKERLDTNKQIWSYQNNE